MSNTPSKPAITPLRSKLKALRQQHGLTLEQLATKIGSKKSYIWELENRDRKPSAEKLWAIAKILGITIDYLLDDQQSEPDDSVKRKAFFHKFDQLSQEDQRRFMAIIDMWISES